MPKHHEARARSALRAISIATVSSLGSLASLGCAADTKALSDAAFVLEAGGERDASVDSRPVSQLDAPLEKPDASEPADVIRQPDVGIDSAPDGAQAESCTVYEPGRICVRGTMATDGELIEAGQAISIQAYPKGCFSSSCTKTVRASCTVVPGNVTTFVRTDFCLANISQGGPCTADCSGGGSASCTGGTWLAGTWPVNLGGTVVQITVPSKLPAGGTCVGSF